jgi:hypothetical protein
MSSADGASVAIARYRHKKLGLPGCLRNRLAVIGPVNLQQLSSSGITPIIDAQQLP